MGLVEEPSKEGAQGNFVQEAFARWRELTENLPKDFPGRFPNGWYRFDYALVGDVKDLELHRFRDALKNAVVDHTGWPLFLFLRTPEREPYEADGVIEWWIKPREGQQNNRLNDAAHCDFWRAAPPGRAFIIRGYQEDGEETFDPRTIFDTTLPIWRMGEALLHARNLASAIADDPYATKVHFRALYTGLGGRVLRSWANPLTDLFVEGSASRSDEAALETTASVQEIEDDLGKVLHPMVASLFERFGVTGLSVDRVRAEVERLKHGRFNVRS